MESGREETASLYFSIETIALLHLADFVRNVWLGGKTSANATARSKQE